MLIELGQRVHDSVIVVIVALIIMLTCPFTTRDAIRGTIVMARYYKSEIIEYPSVGLITYAYSSVSDTESNPGTFKYNGSMCRYKLVLTLAFYMVRLHNVIVDDFAISCVL